MIEIQKASKEDERVIIIAGGNHTANCSGMLQSYFGFGQCTRSRGENDQCLSPKQLKVIGNPLDFFKEEMVKTKAEAEERTRYWIACEEARKKGELQQKPELVLITE
jgi:hypothetical protein